MKPEGETQARADGAEPGWLTHFVNLPGDLSVQLRSKTSGPDVLEALFKIWFPLWWEWPYPRMFIIWKCRIDSLGTLSQRFSLLRVASKCWILLGAHGIPPHCLLLGRLFPTAVVSFGWNVLEMSDPWRNVALWQPALQTASLAEAHLATPKSSVHQV